MRSDIVILILKNQELEEHMENKLEVLYDHYKESFQLSKDAKNRRNMHFVVICILEAVSFLLLIEPQKVFELLQTGLNSELETTISIGNNIIQTLLWVLVVYVMVQYIQDVLYLERQYKYLDELEQKISAEIMDTLFDREGAGYGENYPMVLNMIDIFYKMLSPVLFVVINTIHIQKEWASGFGITLALVCDTVLYVSVFIITWFYFFEIHVSLTKWCKKHIPFIDILAKVLRKILEAV